MLNEEKKVRELELEILRLQTKLRDTHLSDSNADRRALVTLHQHIEALQRECQVATPFSSAVRQSMGLILLDTCDCLHRFIWLKQQPC